MFQLWAREAPVALLGVPLSIYPTRAGGVPYGRAENPSIRCLKRHLVRVIYITMTTREMPAATLVLT